MHNKFHCKSFNAIKCLACLAASYDVFEKKTGSIVENLITLVVGDLVDIEQLTLDLNIFTDNLMKQI